MNKSMGDEYMPEMSESLLKNLEDAGCDEATIQKCLQWAKDKKWQAVRQCLTAHRKTLVLTLRIDTRRIDCLDYLVYQIDKGRTGSS